jgi:outer membrane protein OmpA-like peptidoglycan-associated protein
MIRLLIALGVGLAILLFPVVATFGWTGAAAERLEKAEAEEPVSVAIAENANEQYCTGGLKQILRRVLTSCGLVGAGGTRGCQPLEARNVATMDDADFNALFVPMQQRGAIVQFDQSSAELDHEDRQVVERIFADRKGASYFFVVSRASPEGSTETNRELSKGRAEAVMTHLEETFRDPELERQVGLLWLGEEYAQLDPSFCGWTRSGETEACTPEDLNRSAFIAWIDCTL